LEVNIARSAFEVKGKRRLWYGRHNHSDPGTLLVAVAELSSEPGSGEKYVEVKCGG